MPTISIFIPRILLKFLLWHASLLDYCTVLWSENYSSQLTTRESNKQMQISFHQKGTERSFFPWQGKKNDESKFKVKSSRLIRSKANKGNVNFLQWGFHSKIVCETADVWYMGHSYSAWGAEQYSQNPAIYYALHLLLYFLAHFFIYWEHWTFFFFEVNRWDQMACLAVTDENIFSRPIMFVSRRSVVYLLQASFQLIRFPPLSFQYMAPNGPPFLLFTTWQMGLSKTCYFWQNSHMPKKIIYVCTCSSSVNFFLLVPFFLTRGLQIL